MFNQDGFLHYMIDGVVVDNADPQEMGRLKIYCPAVDGDNIVVDVIPWAVYVSPFGGQAYNYPAGGQAGTAAGPVSYGFWAIPKLGAQVLVSFLYGDPGQRVYLGSIVANHGNRSLPNGRNTATGAPTSDSGEVIEPMTSYLTDQFGDLSTSIARTRGAYERQAASQAPPPKTDAEGYTTRVIKAPDPDVGALDPSTYCITTPGRHAIIMQDDPRFARVRVKTADGSQIILDDANERIYVSVAGGNAWVEIDRDGHVHVYSGASISMAANADVNITAGGDVNIQAGKNVNIAAKGYARLSACSDIALSADADVYLTSGAGMNILAANDIIQTGSNIHLNGPQATQAPCATEPPLIPNHEPWNRPAAVAITRGPNWKA